VDVALGQFALYRFLLAREEPERILFLAITRAACESLFEDAAGRELVASEKLRRLVFDPETERLLEWI